jgi:hypothetical protein
MDYGFDPSGEQQGPFRMTGYTPFGKVPRRAKDKPSVGMTNLMTYDNKTSSKNIHTHVKPRSATLFKIAKMFILRFLFVRRFAFD